MNHLQTKIGAQAEKWLRTNKYWHKSFDRDEYKTWALKQPGMAPEFEAFVDSIARGAVYYDNDDRYTDSGMFYFNDDGSLRLSDYAAYWWIEIYNGINNDNGNG